MFKHVSWKEDILKCIEIRKSFLCGVSFMLLWYFEYVQEAYIVQKIETFTSIASERAALSDLK